MITPDKLAALNGGHRRRKLALCFGSLERDIAGIAEKGHEYSYPSLSRTEYSKKLINIVLTDPQLPEEAKAELEALLSEQVFDERRACNCARNHLLKIIGSFPAEWDLVIAPHKEQKQEGQIEKRNFFPGLCVYAEDIRSPFNLGSIFRTAEAMGAEKVYISPFCTDPLHPRALRSAMGCIETMPWERLSLDDLPGNLPVFVLETGGTPVELFDFPKTGIVIVGSEELGVSPQALEKASYGRVTIPMTGIKASLNVGVAYGILMQAWTAYLQSS